MIPLIEQYNRSLRGLEDTTITMLNRVLDAAFNRLIRRTRLQLKAGRQAGDRNLAILQELRQLIPAYRPDRVDAYDRLLRNLLGPAQRYGLTVADYLTANLSPEAARINVSIPLDATIAAAKQARGYLTRHGQTFAETSAEVVAQGILEGRPTDAMVQDMRQRLNVTKVRATMIVRTESLRAYNQASDLYYSANGVDHVMYYATADDRTCSVCAPRAGRIYKRGEISVPLHVQCRCYLAPWSLEDDALDSSYREARARHRAEVAQSNRSPLSDDLTRALFEQRTPTPVL